jgi:hypothetical protein
MPAYGARHMARRLPWGFALLNPQSHFGQSSIIGDRAPAAFVRNTPQHSIPRCRGEHFEVTSICDAGGEACEGVAEGVAAGH